MCPNSHLHALQSLALHCVSVAVAAMRWRLWRMTKSVYRCSGKKPESKLRFPNSNLERELGISATSLPLPALWPSGVALNDAFNKPNQATPAASAREASRHSTAPPLPLAAHRRQSRSGSNLAARAQPAGNGTSAVHTVQRVGDECAAARRTGAGIWMLGRRQGKPQLTVQQGEHFPHH